MKLSERQSTILKAVITEHIRSAEPVGSKELVEQYDFGVSPATVRAEMSTLEQAGLLQQPHTSAGRVPTDFGYRAYVQSLAHGGLPVKRHRAEVQRRLVRMKHHYEAMARETARLLAEMTEQAAISSVGSDDEPVQSERSGISHLLKLPELKNDELAQAVAQIFDNPESVLSAIKKTDKNGKSQFTEIAVQGGAPVRVFIGHETGHGKVPLSVLVSSFEVDGKRGHLVVLGPQRMAYDKNVALLSYMSRLLSRNHWAVAVALVLPGVLLLRGLQGLA